MSIKFLLWFVFTVKIDGNNLCVTNKKKLDRKNKLDL